MQKVYLVFLVLALGYSVSALAEDRLYVNSEDVVIDQNGIFVNFEGDVISVNTVSHDEQGLYLKFSEIKKLNDLKSWICKRCYNPNIPWRDECYRCGFSAPNYKND